MKKILFLLLIAQQAVAQLTVTGKLISSKDNNAIAGATVSIGKVQTVTDEYGGFSLANINSGKANLLCRSFLFKDISIPLGLTADTTIIITAVPFDFAMEEHLVSAIRATAKTPVAYSEISAAEIEPINYGNDIPYLLQSQPSVVATSDAGNGIGYSGLRIRGTDPSRINVTINNIPLNDAESHQVYWVDLPDLASSVENIQIQRGVGTSTNGAASFGGSINVKTSSFHALPYAETANAAGSFNTLKNTVSIGSGLINNHFFAEARLSRIVSDGYIDRASSELKSFYFSAGYAGKKNLLRATILSGKEVTYQSWSGVPQSRLENDIEGMQQYIIRNFSNDEEANNLLSSGRTYNYYTYKNQVDDYMQDHYQLHYSYQLSHAMMLSTAIHYTYGRGYYEEFKYANDIYGDGLFSSYGLPDFIAIDDTISATDLVRRKWLDNDFYGGLATLTFEPNNRQKLIAGGGWNRYDGRHFHDLKWMQFAGTVPHEFRYYSDTAHKTDGHVFAKYSLEINNNLSIYIDQQIRNTGYEFAGLADSESNLLQQEVKHTFYNPKAGAFFTKGKSSVYASVAIAHKEPNRSDYKESTGKSRPDPEQLTDYEAGFSYHTASFSSAINFYYMDYKDQLVLTGAVNDVGNYTRTNVDRSYRAGAEISASYKYRKFIAGGNVTLSRNKVKNFAEFITNYDDGTEMVFIYNNTDIAFSPSVTGYAFLTFNPVKPFTASLSGKHVGLQYLDNTEQSDRSIDAYSLLDLHLSYSIKPAWIKEIEFGIAIYNLLDTEYISNGYTFGYYYGAMVRENLYYPQAGINFMGRMNIKF